MKKQLKNTGLAVQKMSQPKPPKNDPPVFQYKGKIYPSYLKYGDACSYALPFAKKFCKGKGLDIGGYAEWTYPGARAVNITNGEEYDAYNLPAGKYDYIFSSHTLEHLPLYVKALQYWKEHLKKGGVLFMYLPHPDMEYWLPQNNAKHYHAFNPEELKKVLVDIGYKNVLVSERDLYWSFSVVAFN